MRNRSIWSQSSFRSYRICPDCKAKYTTDRATKRRQYPVIVLALIMLALTLTAVSQGGAWLIPAVLSHIALWVSIGYTLSKTRYVKYED